MAEELASLIVDLRARTSRLEKDLQKSKARVSRQAKKLGSSSGEAMGTAFHGAMLRFLAPAAIIATIRQTMNLGSTITDMAKGVRIGAEEFQILDFAMREAGGESTALAGSLARMQKNIADAGSGLSTAKRGLDNLGLSFSGLRALRPEQQFEAIAKALLNSKDPLKSYGAAMDILGARNAAKLMEVLQRIGRDGFDKLSQDARAAGAVMAVDVAENMDTLADHVANLGRKWNVFIGNFISAAINPRESFLKRQIEEMEHAVALAEKLGEPKAIAELTAKLETLQGKLGEIREADDDAALGPTAAELDALDVAAKRIEHLETVAASAIESIKTPVDKAVELMGELAEAQAAGLLTVEQQGLAGAKAMDMATAAMDEQPEKLNALSAAWQAMGESMSSSLAESLIEGEGSLDDFLARMLKKLAAAALEAAIIAPLLQSIGFSSFFGGGVKGFATGGDPPVNRPSLVGEEGPELFVPRSAGTIMPNHLLSTGTGGGGDVTVHQTLNFNTDLTEVQRQIASAAPSIANATAAQIRDARLRGRN